MKDSSVNEVYRPNSIRTLIRILDASSVQVIERLLKTAIVDKNPSVSSAALVSAYHLLPIARENVRRFQSETQEAASSAKSSSSFLGFGSSQNQLQAPTSNFPQYHAIGLEYQMRAHDRMALVKMIQRYGAAGAVKSPAALVLLVRLAARMAEEDPNLRKSMLVALDGWLRHKSEMVNFEAAKAIVDLASRYSDVDITQTIHTLQMFLTSPRPITKFSAIRVLSSLATFKPDVVRQCNQDMETLISNSNRSIATFAITTLLKTGNESSVDRLMKQISGFMSEISDEFKVTIVEAIRTLCLKFPTKQAGMLAFLSGILRDEGGYDFKRAVVDSMIDLIKFVPESKEEALALLAEFIEDCEFTKLSVRILHLLGLEGPKTSNPTKFIRYIYNRVVLENAIVRAAAVTALGKYGVSCPSADVKKSVHVLLTRCLDDTDDEVRDRAALNLRLMGDDIQDELASKFIRNDSMFSLPSFEHQLVMYVTADNKETFSTAFDITKIPVVTREQADAEDRTKKLSTSTPTLKAPSTGPKKATRSDAESLAASAAATQRYASELQKIPEIAAYGGVLKSSPTVELTESETEYVVTAVKHIFKNAIVLQFDIKNTLPDTLLSDVTVVSVPADDEGGLVEDFTVPVASLATAASGTCYVAFKTSAQGAFAATFSNVLKFTTKEVDPSTNEPEETGYDDEYPVEDIEITGADYVVPAFAGSFDNVWEQCASGEEASETLQLSAMKSISGMILTHPLFLSMTNSRHRRHRKPNQSPVPAAP